MPVIPIIGMLPVNTCFIPTLVRNVYFSFCSVEPVLAEMNELIKEGEIVVDGVTIKVDIKLSRVVT